MPGEIEEVQTEAQVLASVMAGYNGTRGDEPPVEVVPEPSTEQQDVIPVIETPQEPKVMDLAEELKALKAKVQASHSDPDAVRKLHGEIGNINRTLKQMQTPAPAPVIDEDAAALDAVANEFPELAGPLVKAIRAAQSKTVQPQENLDERVAAKVMEIRQRDAQELLIDEHPDYEATYRTPEFSTWLASKTPEFQNRLTTTWNPAVVARGLTEFKDSLKAKAQDTVRKQNRLETAIAPKGVPGVGKSSVIPDEDGLLIGYNKGRNRLSR